MHIGTIGFTGARFKGIFINLWRHLSILLHEFQGDKNQTSVIIHDNFSVK